MAEQYDPEILQKYADTLYSQARSLAGWTALRYAFVLGVIGWFAVAFINSAIRLRFDFASLNAAGLIAAGVGALIGYEIGKAKAFALMLQAQQVLCQRQIELNTRRQDAAMAASQG